MALSGPAALATLGVSEEAIPIIGQAVGTLTLAAAGAWALYEGASALVDRWEARGGTMKPDDTAQGAHTTIVRDAAGRVKKYQDWEPNEPRDPRDPRKWRPGKRFDKNGPAHTNPDGSKVETPHINEPDGTARPPRPEELPRP